MELDLKRIIDQVVKDKGISKSGWTGKVKF